MNRPLAVALGGTLFAAALSVWSLRDGFTLAFMFPGLAALTMLALGGLMLAQSVATRAPAPEPEEGAGGWAAVAGATAALIAFAWATPLLGFYVTAALAFMALALCAGRPGGRGWLVLPASALAVSATVWVVFDRILAVEAPAGLLF